MPSPSSHAPERAPGRQPESLPFAVVDDLFHRLSLVYGHNFLGRFSGIDLGAVKEEWRHQLAGITGDEIDFALSNLPEKPPESAIAFRKLARSMPDERRVFRALPAPKKAPGVPAAHKAVLEQLRPREDEEPIQVRAARNTIAELTARTYLSDVHKGVLKCAHKVIERHERQLVEEARRQQQQQHPEAAHAAAQH